MTNEGFDHTPRWVAAEQKLRTEVDNWITGAIFRQKGVPWRGIHDEANYTAQWPNYYLLSGKNEIREFLYELRDSYIAWSSQNEYHGFRPDARDYVTHTFENHGFFITSLCTMEPDNQVNNALIEDVAHHIGNWVEGIPDWYDWGNHMFTSHWVGTKEVRDYPPYDFDCARHGRVGRLAMTAYHTSGKERYIDWCRDWMEMWVSLTLRCEERIPMSVFPREMSVEESVDIYGEDYGDPYQGNRWASETVEIINFILDLYALNGGERYLEAVRHAVDIYRGNLDQEKYNELLLKYQRITGDNRYDDELKSWYRDEIRYMLDSDPVYPTAMIIENGRRYYGTRKSSGQIAELDYSSPGFFLQAFRLSGDLEWIVRGMNLAAEELGMASHVLRDGWEHGCAGGRFIHGCGNRATDVLYNVVGIDRFFYYGKDGKLGLPEDLCVLITPDTPKSEVEMHLYNSGEEAETVRIVPRTGEKISEAVSKQKITKSSNTVELNIQPQKEFTLKLLMA